MVLRPRMSELWLLLLLFAEIAFSAQPSAPSPIPAPLRELPWGQLNFLHTTDVHGWWGGHLQEPSFSADWGDYISFAKHLHDKADEEGSDLLIIDTGDRIEGNAIYDASKPPGKFTYDIAKEQHIDLISSGNHELYKKNSSEGEYYHTVPNFKGNYLASNLDIYNPKTGKLEPLAPRYKKFTTKNQGIRILAFGFIFDFTGNANNTVIHTVGDTVKEDWFNKAIRDKNIDLIVVFGHVDIRSHEYATLFSRIRKVQWDTPIHFFGGHSHIRDYKVFDDKSVALESGRYMETLGFASIKGLSTGGNKSSPTIPQESKIEFGRRYIDNNLFSLQHHTCKDAETFPTKHGLNVSAKINDARETLGLGKRFGCAPHDFWVNRRPYPHEESIFTWLEKQVMPDTISQSAYFGNASKAIVIYNTGAMRFDIFKGPFTKDTTWLVSPFTSGLRYIKDVPYKSASRVLKLLNNEGPILERLKREVVYLTPPEHTAVQYRPHMLFSRPVQAFWDGNRIAQMPVLSDLNQHSLIPGYTTTDDSGQDGDDTMHYPIPFFKVPNCIQSNVGFDPTDKDELPEKVDLMYNEFVEKWILLALQYLGEKVGEEDTLGYLEGEKTFTDFIVDWVKQNWEVEGECPS